MGSLEVLKPGNSFLVFTSSDCFNVLKTIKVVEGLSCWSKLESIITFCLPQSKFFCNNPKSSGKIPLAFCRGKSVHFLFDLQIYIIPAALLWFWWNVWWHCANGGLKFTPVQHFIILHDTWKTKSLVSLNGQLSATAVRWRLTQTCQYARKSAVTVAVCPTLSPKRSNVVVPMWVMKSAGGGQESHQKREMHSSMIFHHFLTEWVMECILT